MIVYSWAGLCNRLRVLFSYLLIANKNNDKLTMIWEKNRACPGYFLDYFKPIENVEFSEKVPEIIDFKTNGQHKKTRKLFIYKKLLLKDELKDKINKNKNILGDFIAVQIRRTDTISTPWKRESYIPDEDYINFLNKYPDHNIYIATDNYNTQNKFYNLFKDRIKVINLINKPKKYVPAIRQTTIEETIIDIYMCVNSKHFMGSPYSSVTTLINELRNNNHLS